MGKEKGKMNQPTTFVYLVYSHDDPAPGLSPVALFSSKKRARRVLARAKKIVSKVDILTLELNPTLSSRLRERWGTDLLQGCLK